MALGITKLDSGVNQTTTGAYSSLSVTIPEGARALVFAKLVSNARTMSTVAGTGITFELVSEGATNTNDHISWWKAEGPTGGFTGTITMTPSGGIAQGHWCVLLLSSEASNDTDWLVQSPAIVNVTATSVTVPLNAPRDTGSRSIIGVGGSLFGGLTDSASQTELCDHPGNSPAGAFAVSWSDTAWDANPTYTGSSQNLGALALEISITNVVVPPSGILPQVWDGATWITADAVWTWDGAAWVEGTVHAFDGVDWQ